MASFEKPWMNFVVELVRMLIAFAAGYGGGQV